MDAVKAFISIVLCIVLLAAEVIAMGLFSLERALSDDAIGDIIQTTMAGTDITETLVEETLAKSRLGKNQRYGELAEAVLETEAMTGFFAGYLADAVNEQTYGEPAEEVTEEELKTVFAEGIDEVNEEGLYTISEKDKKRLMKAMNKEIPRLMEKMSKHTDGYGEAIAELTEITMGEEMGLLYDMRKYMDKTTRMMVLGACAVICLVLLALNWRSRFGFFWCGMVTALVSGLYWGLSFVGAEKIISYMLHTTYLQEAALTMITSGLQDAALMGSIAAAAFLVIFAGLKITGRRKNV